MSETITIKKIPLEPLLTLLRDLYFRGVNFIDLEGTTADEQDVVTVKVEEAYLAFEEGGDVKLTDDSLDVLI